MFSSCDFQVVTNSENPLNQDVLLADLESAEFISSLKKCSEDISRVTIPAGIDFAYVFPEQRQDLARFKSLESIPPSTTSAEDVPRVTISENLDLNYVLPSGGSNSSLLARSGEDVPRVTISENLDLNYVLPSGGSNSSLLARSGEDVPRVTISDNLDLNYVLPSGGSNSSLLARSGEDVPRVAISENLDLNYVLPSGGSNSSLLARSGEDVPRVTISDNLDLNYVLPSGGSNSSLLARSGEDVPRVTISENLVTQKLLPTKLKLVKSSSLLAGSGEDVPRVSNLEALDFDYLFPGVNPDSSLLARSGEKSPQVSNLEALDFDYLFPGVNPDSSLLARSGDVSEFAISENTIAESVFPSVNSNSSLLARSGDVTEFAISENTLAESVFPSVNSNSSLLARSGDVTEFTISENTLAESVFPSVNSNSSLLARSGDVTEFAISENTLAESVFPSVNSNSSLLARSGDVTEFTISENAIAQSVFPSVNSNSSLLARSGDVTEFTISENAIAQSVFPSVNSNSSLLARSGDVTEFTISENAIAQSVFPSVNSNSSLLARSGDVSEFAISENTLAESVFPSVNPNSSLLARSGDVTEFAISENAIAQSVFPGVNSNSSLLAGSGDVSEFAISENTLAESVFPSVNSNSSLLARSGDVSEFAISENTLAESVFPGVNSNSSLLARSGDVSEFAISENAIAESVFPSVNSNSSLLARSGDVSEFAISENAIAQSVFPSVNSNSSLLARSGDVTQETKPENIPGNQVLTPNGNSEVARSGDVSPVTKPENIPGNQVLTPNGNSEVARSGDVSPVTKPENIPGNQVLTPNGNSEVARSGDVSPVTKPENIPGNQVLTPNGNSEVGRSGDVPPVTKPENIPGNQVLTPNGNSEVARSGDVSPVTKPENIPAKDAPAPTTQELARREILGLTTPSNVSTPKDILPVGIKFGKQDVLSGVLVKGNEDGSQAVNFEEWLIPYESFLKAFSFTVTPLPNGNVQLRSPGLVKEFNPKLLIADSEIGEALSIAEIRRQFMVEIKFDIDSYAIVFEGSWLLARSRDQKEAKPVTPQREIKVIDPQYQQLPAGTSAVYTSVGTWRQRQQHQSLGSVSGLVTGAGYRYGISNDLTVGFGGVYDSVNFRSFGEVIYSHSQLPLTLGLRSLSATANQASSLTFSGSFRLNQNSNISWSMGEQPFWRLNNNFQPIKNVRLQTELSNTGLNVRSFHNLSLFGVSGNLSLGYEQKNNSSRTFAETSTRWRWGNLSHNLDGRFEGDGGWRLRNSLQWKNWQLDVTNSYKQVIFSRFNAEDSEIWNNLSFPVTNSNSYQEMYLVNNLNRHKNNSIKDQIYGRYLKSDNNSLIVAAWRHNGNPASIREQLERTNWSWELGYGFGSQSSGLVASVTTPSLFAGLSLKAGYSGASVQGVSSQFSVGLVMNLNLNLQDGISTDKRNASQFEGNGAILVQPFYDENNNGVRDRNEALITPEDNSLFMLNNLSLKENKSLSSIGNGTVIPAPIGEHRLDLDPAGYPIGWEPREAAFAVEVAPGAYTIVKVPFVKTATVEGKLRNQLGQPVNGARVEAISTSNQKRYFSITSPSGAFYLDNLPLGEYTLNVGGLDITPRTLQLSKSEFVQDTLELQVFIPRDGQTADRAAVPTYTISGYLKDKAAENLRGIKVTAIHTQSGKSFTSITDIQGFFKFQDLIQGEYQIKMGDFTVEPDKFIIDNSSPWENNMTLQVNAFKQEIYADAANYVVRGILTDDGGARLSQVEVILTEVETNQKSLSETNALGAFILENLPVGKYKIEVKKGAEELEASPKYLEINEESFVQSTVNIEVNLK